MVDVVVVVVAEVASIVVGCSISSSPDRHLVTMSSFLDNPPPVFTFQPLHCDRGQLTYLSSSFTKSPLKGHLVLGVICQETQMFDGNGVRVSLLREFS